MSENSSDSVSVLCPLIYSPAPVFPGMAVQISIADNPRAAENVQKAAKAGERIFVLINDKNNAHQIGTLGLVAESGKSDSKGNKIFIFKAESRAKMVKSHPDIYFAAVAPLTESTEATEDLIACANQALINFVDYLEMSGVPEEQIEKLLKPLAPLSDTKPFLMADKIAAKLDLEPQEEQKLLEMLDPAKRLGYLTALLESEMAKMKIDDEITARTMDSIDKIDERYFLEQKKQEIMRALGETGEDDKNLKDLTKKVLEAGMSKQALEKCQSDLKKLQRLHPQSPETNVLIDYLNWMVSLPWSKKSAVVKDLKGAEEILNADHYGLDEVKESILEHLAVQQRSDKMKGSIICLVGPPGVGKTSLGQSIAKATGRNFLRISLGGIHNESEVRGHSRTYVGAQPGKLITSMKKAGTINPLIQLDEIDKMGQGGGVNGDPSAAMLEVLDPEQNNTFNDHYINVDYDLSNAMFICTANDLGAIPGPLRDRMKIIDIPGYTAEEKLEIAKRHLVPKSMKEAALQPSEFSIDDAALLRLINDYTAEAGVRNLEREIGTLTSKVVLSIDTGRAETVAITADNLEEYMGIPRVHHTTIKEMDKVGYINGMYYTPIGGGVVPIEATRIETLPGEGGHFIVTGQLGDVMKESAKIAETVVRSNARKFGITHDMLKNNDIHIHALRGATPKDGPSAGLAITTAIVSAFTGIAIRRDVAMTGEIATDGTAMSIGGVKEKLLGALGAGVKKVLIPKSNLSELAEVPDNVKQSLEIVPVASIMEVLQHALVKMPKPVSANKRLKSTTASKAQDFNTALKAIFDAMSKNTQSLEPANDTPQGNAQKKKFHTALKKR